ncbi:oxygenase MpaB family protein [Tsukamurella sp. 8F]|uniref:oxygenase MpaB family protein n=1 Tax=unclassified Tsukamurella TaxID=2633480 RepID=UPI0023B953A5|nr:MULTISPECIES: oxygenase MpaB family protein [unclassified Tsukamurella]MDF0528901.1 oxygenase MpaB family protein [Tsukamurella sp. 8J]MDF0586736.1 oxygenase MpaB family protein [Tsukamurella sp. 8F]
MNLSSDALRITDLGFFGPDSPTWRVWTSPTALIAFQRAVALEHFDPDLAAAVADSAGIYTDPFGRLDRTLSYFLLVALADGRTAVAASEHLMDVHAKATGIEPVTGRRYAANNPDSQLWIHVTGWHSVLKCYEMFGPGLLSPADEARYWRDCVTAAELQTCRVQDVPTSRAEVRAYFERVRPTLCMTERARRGMHYLLHTRGKGPRIRIGSELLAPAAVATLPAWMRELAGTDQPGMVDRGYPHAVRPVVSALGAANGRGTVKLASIVAPHTATILRRHFTQGATAGLNTVTPAEAKNRYSRRAAA